MLCSACGLDKQPIIEMAQGTPGRNEFGASAPAASRFMYTCGNAACHAPLGPVKSEEPSTTAKALPAVTSPTQATAVAAEPVPLAVSPVNHVVAMRARLDYLEKVLGPLNEERDFLRKMLDASTPKRRVKNVIPFTTPKEA